MEHDILKYSKEEILERAFFHSVSNSNRPFNDNIMKDFEKIKKWEVKKYSREENEIYIEIKFKVGLIQPKSSYFKR